MTSRCSTPSTRAPRWTTSRPPSPPVAARREPGLGVGRHRYRQRMSNPRAGMVDWDLAVSIGARLAGDGPSVTWADAAAVVEELRADANRSTGLVREFTGLQAPADTAPIVVVDRAGWIQANADGFATMLAPIVDKLSGDKEPSRVAHAVGSRVTGAEVGGLLGFLAGKVLGQFDPFFAPSGRLLLVAPNIVHVERELEVDPQ